MHALIRNIVLIYGPLCFTNLFEIYISTLVVKQIKTVANRKELESFLTNESPRVCLAILFNLYPSFDDDIGFLSLIKDIRTKKMKFPLIALSLSKLNAPIFKEIGHIALKLPLCLEELKNPVISHRDLKDNELKTIVNKHCKPLEYLNKIVSRFKDHDLPKLDNSSTKDSFFSNYLPLFKKDFLCIYNNREFYFSGESNIILLIDEIYNHLESSDEKIIASKYNLKNALQKIIDYCGG